MTIEVDSFYLRCELSYSIQIIFTVGFTRSTSAPSFTLHSHLRFNFSFNLLLNFFHSFPLIFYHFCYLTTWNTGDMLCAPLLTNFQAHLPNTVVSKISAWMVEYLSTLPTQYLNWSHWSIPVLSISSAISFLICVSIVDNLSENFRQ